MTEAEKGRSGFGLTVEARELGSDRVFLVTGGAAHIGAAATAYLTEEDTVAVQVSAVPGHKEAELASEWAEYAAQELRQTVTVVMGIHFDHASKETINAIVEEVRRLMKEEVGLAQFGAVARGDL